MDLTGTMAHSPAHVTLTDLDIDDDIAVIEQIPDDPIILDDTDTEEVEDDTPLQAQHDGQGDDVEAVVGALGHDVVLVGLPDGDLAIDVAPLTAGLPGEDEPMEDVDADTEDDETVEAPTIDLAVGDDETHAPTSEIHRAGLHRYATDSDDSVHMPPSATLGVDGPSP